jgi:hypothetical protein
VGFYGGPILISAQASSFDSLCKFGLQDLRAIAT